MHNNRCNINNNNNNNISDFKQHKLVLESPDSFQNTSQWKVSRKKLCFKEMQNTSKTYFYTTAFQFWEQKFKESEAIFFENM